MALQTINGIALWCESRGQGEPVILIHGLTADHNSMEVLAQWLLPQYQVITYDCRGHGLSEKPAHYTLADHVKDLLALMDFYQVDTCRVVGMSMGTYIAQAAAIAAPKRISHLALLVPKAHGKTSSVQRILQEAGQDISQLSQAEIMAIIGSKSIAPTTSPEILAQMSGQTASVELTAEQKAAVDEALAGFDLRPDLSQITAKTIVFSGQYDGLNPPELGREVAQGIKGAQFVLFEHSGHILHLEEADKCHQQLLAFLAQ